MLGASLYLAEGNEKNRAYLKEMSAAGVKKFFTSLHIPEDDPEETVKVLEEIANEARVLEVELITDVSSETMRKHELTERNIVEFLENLGIKSLRLDYGLSFEEIKALDEEFTLVLNASTIDEQYCIDLEKAGVDLWNITVCHNFYPRENTGLDRAFFLKRNEYLKEKGFKIMAFIAGDGEKRGPVFAGLPTLEEHRQLMPLEAYLDLTENCLVDEVVIGDISVSETALSRLMKWVQEKTLLLSVMTVEEEFLPDNFFEVHKNRPDLAADVIRASQSRLILNDQTIQPYNCDARDLGSVTLDNARYGRYAGELQIAKIHLPKDERVNVLAQVKEPFLGLLDYIGPNVHFQFYKE